jgi:uncharacterized protein HemY
VLIKLKSRIIADTSYTTTVKLVVVTAVVVIVVVVVMVIKRPGREADHSPPFSAEVNNCGAIPPLPMWLNVVVLN